MNGILIAIVVLLGIVVLAQVMKIFEVSSEIKKGEDNKVSERDNDIQGTIMFMVGMLFIISVIWMYVAWGDKILPKPASLHGAEVDALWNTSMIIINIVFFIVQPILFWFAFRYRGKKGQKASYYEHNNKLEFLWTIIPALALAVLITWGLSTWGNIMNPENEEEPIVIELYAQQFAWTARYSGGDNQLGYANVNLIGGTNALGVDVSDPAAGDDIIAKEIHLPVNKPVLFKMRSQDVIHSAFMPHFRAQMNCVPGAVTQFQFTPTVTTSEMQVDPYVMDQIQEINEIRAGMGEDPYDFGYVLLCNKICGSAHYNMQLPIIVESEEDYNNWLREQKTLAETL
jgi:cytochrome c oxidase subunit II